VKDYKSDKLCEMAFHICLYPKKFQEFLNVKQIPLVLLKFSDLNISDEKLFEYFFPSRVFLLDAYLRVNPDLKLFQKLNSLFEEWKVGKELEAEKMKIKQELKTIESKLNKYVEDFWIERITKNPKIYKTSPETIRNNKRILFASPTNFKFASKKLRNDDDLIHQLMDHKYFYLIFKFLPNSYRMQRKYALLAIKSSTRCFKNIEKSIIDKEFILKMCEFHPVGSVEISPNVVLNFPKELFKETEIVTKMLQYSTFEFSKFPIEFRSIPEIATVALKKFGFNYIYLGDNLKGNLEYVKYLIHSYPPYFQNYVPYSVKSDPTSIRELIAYNPSLFFWVGEECKTKENFIICLENFNHSNYKVDQKKIPKEFCLSRDLMELGIEINPKNLVFFSEENELFPYGILKHMKLYREEYQRRNSTIYSTFQEFYFGIFPNLWNYLKTKMILETKNKNEIHHLERFHEISGIGDSKIFRKIGLCLNGIYEILSYEDEKIGKLNDLKFQFE
jgi:hypothetical protein